MHISKGHHRRLAKAAKWAETMQRATKLRPVLGYKTRRMLRQLEAQRQVTPLTPKQTLYVTTVLTRHIHDERRVADLRFVLGLQWVKRNQRNKYLPNGKLFSATGAELGEAAVKENHA